MEPIKELRQMLQEEKVNPVGWKRPWGYKTFQRGPSIYITRLLLATRVTPNQVTLGSIFLGLVGCWFMLQFEWYLKLIGLFLLYLNILADKVDGEIARYKKIYSLRGIFWDEINHLVIPPIFWFSLTLGISKITFLTEPFLFTMAFAGALGLIVIRVTHSLAPQIYAKKYLKQPEIFSLPQKEITDVVEAPITRFALIHLIARALHHLHDFFIMIALSAILLVIERAYLPDYIFHPLIAYMIIALSFLFVLVALETTIKKSRSVEKEITKIISP